jgi:hypothetical protein
MRKAWRKNIPNRTCTDGRMWVQRGRRARLWRVVAVGSRWFRDVGYAADQPGSQPARRLKWSAGAVPVVRVLFFHRRLEPPQPTIRLDENHRRNPHPVVIAVAHGAQPEIFSLDVAK